MAVDGISRLWSRSSFSFFEGSSCLSVVLVWSGSVFPLRFPRAQFADYMPRTAWEGRGTSGGLLLYSHTMVRLSLWKNCTALKRSCRYRLFHRRSKCVEPTPAVYCSFWLAIAWTDPAYNYGGNSVVKSGDEGVRNWGVLSEGRKDGEFGEVAYVEGKMVGYQGRKIFRQ
jgi:hypothetical protein